MIIVLVETPFVEPVFDTDHATGALIRHPLVCAEQKPGSLMTHQLNTLCPPRGTNTDFCFGSGSTANDCLLAPHNSIFCLQSRQFLFFESNAFYYKIVYASSAQRRFQHQLTKGYLETVQKVPPGKGVRGRVLKRRCMPSTTKIQCFSDVPTSIRIHYVTVF